MPTQTVAETGDAPANFANRTLFTADNLSILRGIDSETVDLIYLDPPFNSNDDYAGLVDTQSGDKVLATFKDTWTLDDVKSEWPDEIEAENPALWHAVVGAGQTAGDSMQAFLTIMAVRLIEMHRVLKPTGSIYLHCDDSAAAYLEQLMDAVFGRSRRLKHDHMEADLFTVRCQEVRAGLGPAAVLRQERQTHMESAVHGT